MNKEIIKDMVSDILSDKYTQFIESISCDEFIEEVTDKLIEGGTPIDVEDEDQIEEVKEVIGSVVVDYLMKQILPKKVIEVDIMFGHPNDDETKKVYDIEGMTEEFEYKLKQVIKNN